MCIRDRNSFPLPKFHQEPGAFRIDFPLAQETVRTSGKPSGKPSGKTGGENKADTRGRLIKMIKKTPAITIAQLADSLGLTHQGVAWHINKLKKEGLLTRQGSSRRGSWHFNS